MNIKLCIQPEFYNEEIRNEYLVTTKLKKIWAIELDLLNEFLKLCKLYDINVVAWAGTMLGAVRHGGFIPWDDDMDVAMTRQDYDKFIKIVDGKFAYPYFLQTAYNDRKFFFGYARFRNSDTTGFITYNDDIEYNNGIYIDVFVLDGYGENEDKILEHNREIRKCQRLLSLYNSSKIPKNRLKYPFKLLVKWIVNKLYTYDDLLIKYKEIMMKYKESNRIGLLTHSEDFQRKYWCSPEDFNEIIYMDFEMLKVPVPKNYDEILTHMYGNYMEFPSVEKRGIWHKGIIEFDPDTPYKEYMKNRDRR